MSSVTLEEAQARLPQLIAQLKAGDELYITQDDNAVACLVAVATPSATPRRPGSGKGEIVILHEDEEHLKDFEPYMP